VPGYDCGGLSDPRRAPAQPPPKEIVMSPLSRLLAVTALGLLGAISASTAVAEHYDPPGRVARISHLQGDAAFSPAGEDVWLEVSRNRPLIRGDRLWTERNSRLEMQIGGASIRLGSRTSFEFLNLSDAFAQMEVTQGSINLSVRRLHRGQGIEVATPALAFAIERAGRYRIDVERDRTTVVVFEGEGTAYGERDNFPVYAGESVRFYGNDLGDYELYGLPRSDSFDRYCFERDRRLERSLALRYVDEDLIGYADLDDYGSWRQTRRYGVAWYPSVGADWAPYRDGHWIWQDPWGWTWVDDSPWGFAPFHYGRWAYDGRWCWIPGPRQQRPVYAPALVAFVGGRNWSLSISFRERSPIGWIPLGPNEAYVPWYQSSRDYFARVNAANTIINDTTINNVYNSYVVNRRGGMPMRYANRDVAGAFTAVPSDVFVNSRPVRGAALQLDRRALTTADLALAAPVAPSVRSVHGNSAVTDTPPAREVLERRVIARTAPAAGERPFRAREEELRRDPGRGLGAPTTAPARGRPTDARGNVRVLAEPQRNADVRSEPPTRGGADPQATPLPPLDRASERDAARGRTRETMPRESTPTMPRREDEARTPAPDPRGDAQRRRDDAAREQMEAERERRESEREQARQQQADERAAEQARRDAESRAQMDAERERLNAEREQARQRQAEERAAEQARRDAESRAQMDAERERLNAEREQARQRQAEEREAEQRAAERERADEQRAEVHRRMEEAREQQRAERERQAAEQAEERAREQEERAQQRAAEEARRNEESEAEDDGEEARDDRRNPGRDRPRG
jgi:hypothetical protein